MAKERIVDLVFAGEPGGRWQRLAGGAVVVVAIYATAVLALGQVGGAGATFSAELAARIHDALAAEREVDIKLPPPAPTPEPASERAPVARAAPHARAPAAHHAPAAPAQAGQIAAAAEAPVDFTGSAFVVGSGNTYAGGTTTASGTSRTAVSGAVAPNAHGNGQAARSRARAVTLDQASWACPWPAEGDARQVDQETVVLRASVRADGRVDRVDVLEDPGYGFGRAARDCALASRAFAPALDADGKQVAAQSPPIRVHFFR